MSNAVNPTPAASEIHLSRAQMLLGYVTASYGFAFSTMLSFLVPLRALEIGTPIEFIGLIVGAAAVVPALLAVPSGELSDRLGPRKTYIISTLVSGLATFAAAGTESYWVLFAIQLVAGFARSTAWVSSQVYLTSVGRPDQRATITGRMSFATNAGMIAAPLLVGASAELVGFQYTFVTLAVVSLLYCLMGTRLTEVRVPRVTKRSGASGGFGLALTLLRLKGMQVVLQLTFVRLWNATCWMAFYPLLLLQQGFTPARIGTLLAVYAVVSTVVTLTAGWFSARMGNALATAFSLAVGVLGVVLSPYAYDYPLVFLPAILVGFAQGLSLPLLVATVSEEAPPDQRGIALGLRMSVNQGAGTLAPVMTGAVAASIGLTLGLLFNGVVGALVLGSSLWMYRGARRSRKNPAENLQGKS